MITKAHYDSKQFILDPVYSIHGKNPEDPVLPDAPYWHYGHYECEAFLLKKMIREKNEAKLKVGYTKNLLQPQGDAAFSLSSDVAGTIEFRASGSVRATLNGKEIYADGADDPAKKHILSLPEPGKLVIHLHVDDPEQTIPALLPLNVVDGWQYNGTEPVRRPQNSNGIPPHLAERPQISLNVVPVTENIWDAGVELLAYVDIESSTEPELFIGESIPEVENEDSAEDEQTRELVKTGENLWTSKVPLALRYIRLKNATAPRISLRALFHPVEYKGAFAWNGEDDMTRIWMISAYTLHLCMHNFLLDGIKRDRLPWAGDLAVSLMGNAYSFGDAALVRDSLAVLCANGIQGGHVNNIADYTMWWIINHELYQLYYEDPAFLAQEYPRINETLDILLAKSDENGFLTANENEWFFIDWVPGEKVTAVQILFFRSLRAAAALAERMQDEPRKQQLLALADRLAASIRRLSFDAEKGLFAETPAKEAFSRHANLLAVVTGLVNGAEAAAIAQALSGKELPLVGTPYMSVFESLAMVMGGRAKNGIALIREIWGGMMNLGATSFWEGYDPRETGLQHYVFYDRPFGKSLCHAWGAGPLFLLPQVIAGLEPVSDGWKEFKLQPMAGVSCAVTVPTPYGLIEAEIENGEVIKVTAPAECKRIG